jgi:hypothetical protein
MNDYIFLMHNDATEPISAALWEPYFAALRAKGVFQGGSAIGGGETLRNEGVPAPVNGHLGGYIRVTAEGLDEAKQLVIGNPVFECGGTVEVRELPRT